MPRSRRFKAPAGNGDVLADPGFDAVPALVAANRRTLDRNDVVVGGLPLKRLRALARREALNLARSPGTAVPGLSPDAPLLLAGHQPELSHPGVWVKHFALHGLARKLGGTPLNLVVDNDTLKSTSLRLPVFRDHDPKSVHLESVRFDALDGETPYEDRVVLDPELFRTFPDRAAPLWKNWGYEPLLASASRDRQGAGAQNIGEAFASLRRACEQRWGCDNLELPVSRLARTEAFARFVGHLTADLRRFREVYNAAIHSYREMNGVRSANHPAPDLARDEAPFWVWRRGVGERSRLVVASNFRGSWWHVNELTRIEMPDPDAAADWLRAWESLDHLGYRVRPRALTLTLFARLCLGDFFLHGIGGGKYDEVTDGIIRDYFGVDPPAYQVLSATLHLPLPGFPSTEDEVRRVEHCLRDLHWNPQRHLPPAAAHDPLALRLLADKVNLAHDEPPDGDHAARQEWFRGLQSLTNELRPFVADQFTEAEVKRDRVRVEARANAVLRRRDYSWVLYPEGTLRPFLGRFLEA
jgi:hypothetical protein